MKFLRLQSHIVDLTGVNYVNWIKPREDKGMYIINLYNISGQTLSVSFDSEEKCEAAFEKIATALEGMTSIPA